MSKIMILSSSPQRDKLVDLLLAERLKALGNEVYLQSIPVGAQKAILEIQPNIIVAPPIRQRFAYDLMETAGKFGIGIVIRHIEPGCDTEDLEKMPEFWQKVLLLIRPVAVKLELFWSRTEPEFVKTHGIKTPVVAVGAFVADVYKDKKLSRKVCAKNELFSRHKLDLNKRLLLVSSPWGLIDQAPDNLDKTAELCWQDLEARNKWCAMITGLSRRLSDKWNILATLHPKLAREFYKKSLAEIPIDTSSTATELLFHSDALVHAGSTMAIEMHWLNKPSYQFGDVNSLDLPDGNWWQRRGCAISKVSPYCLDVDTLANAIENTTEGSNANPEAVKVLEQGRYGLMDGRATERAAKLINRIDGEFKLYWPEPLLNYDQLFIFKNASRMLVQVKCMICDGIFCVVDKKWLDEINKAYNTNIAFPKDNACPHCASVISRIEPIEKPIRNLVPKMQ